MITISLDDVDKMLLQMVQDDFPVEVDPWMEIGCRLGISKEDVISRIDRLHSDGIIRKIGPIVESKKIGLRSSTLILMRVPESRLEEVAEIVNSYKGVTHNYERECEFNLWFTLNAEDEEALQAITDEIRGRTETEPMDFLSLKTMRRFKIGVRYDFKQV